MRLWAWIILCLAFSCKGSEKRQNDVPSYVQFESPSGFVPMVFPKDNPLTKEGIALGRRLFYDPILSADSTMSCSSCHLQQKGFADGKPLSIGIKGKEVKRSAMSLVNVGYYYTGLFWDGRIQHLEEQALLPVEDPLELASDWDSVEWKLQQHPDYPKLFQEAFGVKTSASIDRNLVVKALAQFERTILSHDTKFDQVNRGEAEFTEAEQRGWNIFFDASKELPNSECGHCHTDPLFTNLDYENNGIEMVQNMDGFPDKGRGRFTANKYDNGRFRVPTLRNIAITAPYMHDGRFETLEEVLAHYEGGGHAAENLSPNVRKLNFSNQDKKDLIAFLNTLTDSTLLQNHGLSNPFLNN